MRNTLPIIIKELFRNCTGTFTVMRASREPPSMLELCETFRKRKERLWSLEDGSELEKDPYQRRIMTRALSTQHTEERTGPAMDAGKELPLRRTQARRRRKADSKLASPSLVVNEENDGYADGRIDESVPNLDPQRRAHNMKQSSRALYKEDMNRNKNFGDQAKEIYRPKSNELSPPQRGQRSIGTQTQVRASAREVKHESRPTQSCASERGIEKLPPIQSCPGNQDTTMPLQLDRIDEHREDQVLEAFRTRRYGRQEVCEERDQRRRRIGVCQVSDATREHRTFVRVLNKRF